MKKRIIYISVGALVLIGAALLLILKKPAQKNELRILLLWNLKVVKQKLDFSIIEYRIMKNMYLKQLFLDA